MPIKNLLGVPVVILSNLDDDINIDMMEEVTVQYQSLVTQNPTETGRNISDNTVNLPVVISMVGRFVDTPFATGLQAFNPLASFASIAKGIGGGVSIQQWEALERLRAGQRPFTVVVQQGTYIDMVFRSLSAPRTKGDGTSQKFQAEMVQVVTVGINLLEANILAAGVVTSGTPTTNVGPQSTTPFSGPI